MCNTALCQRAGGLGRDKTIEQRPASERVTGCPEGLKMEYSLSQKESAINDSADILESHFTSRTS